jgi:predicted small secreted protein
LLQEKERMARKFIIALGVAAITLTATACNTVKGLGRDIQSVGEAGDRAT